MYQQFEIISFKDVNKIRLYIFKFYNLCFSTMYTFLFIFFFIIIQSRNTSVELCVINLSIDPNTEGFSVFPLYFMWHHFMPFLCVRFNTFYIFILIKDMFNKSVRKLFAIYVPWLQETSLLICRMIYLGIFNRFNVS